MRIDVFESIFSWQLNKDSFCNFVCYDTCVVSGIGCISWCDVVTCTLLLQSLNSAVSLSLAPALYRYCIRLCLDLQSSNWLLDISVYCY